MCYCSMIPKCCVVSGHGIYARLQAFNVVVLCTLCVCVSPFHKPHLAYCIWITINKYRFTFHVSESMHAAFACDCARSCLIHKKKLHRRTNRHTFVHVYIYMVYTTLTLQSILVHIDSNTHNITTKYVFKMQ